MCENCDYEYYDSCIEEMLDEPALEWALETLEGILKWIQENQHITEKQIEALNNIYSTLE